MARTPAEISEIAARRSPYVYWESQIEDLRRQIESAGKHAEPFFDLVPIRLTTIIEQAVRGIVEEAVDHGDPYSGRGIAMISRWSGKIIADALLAFSEKKVTLGQLASHGFSVGRLAEIIAILESVFGADFSKQLGMIRTKWVEPDQNGPLPIIEDRELTIATIDRLLTVRHIVVHERTIRAPYVTSDIPLFIDHAYKFISALYWIMVDRLYGAIPYTQTEMNIRAGKSAAEASKELDALRGGVAADFEPQKNEFQKLEYHWDRFCDLAARKHAGYLNEGPPGTIAPLLYASAQKQMLRWRIEQFKAFGNRWAPV